MIFVYPGTVSTFTGDRHVALSSGYVEVSDEDYDDLVSTKKMWDGLSIVDDPTYPARHEEEIIEEMYRENERQIEELKAQLASSDYKAIKYAEGWISDEEYAPIKAEREAIRQQIRDLSESLK